MYHGAGYRKLGKKSGHRMAMFANMATSLIENERIETTVPKAKDLRRIVERLITKGKGGSLSERRKAFSILRSDAGVEKLFGNLAERFKTRNGGYTRVLKLAGTRAGDAAPMAIIEFVDYVLPAKKTAEEKKKDKASTKEQAKAAKAAKTPKAAREKSAKPKVGKSAKAGGTGSMKQSGSRGG